MSWLQRLTGGLKKTADALGQNLKLAISGKRLDAATCDAVEEALLQADLGVRLSSELVEKLRQQKFDGELSLADVQAKLADDIATRLSPVAKPLELPQGKRPLVLLMVGVNGAGKTTTIGKLTRQFKDSGKSILLAAADTYRAGAVDQLKIWAGRVGVEVIAPEKENADPAALLFHAYEQAQQQNVDLLICDTAGRLQNRQDLMAQLEKMIRVLKKHDPDAPHICLLVLDATVGQNAHSQVDLFRQVAGVTGLVITKLDSTAKGGVVVSLADTYKLPIHYIGVGEKVEDLQPFAAQDFAKALLGLQK